MSFLLPILDYLPEILMGVFGGITAWWLWQSGAAVTSGVQQAAPGIGAAVGSVGMMFTLLPVMMMFAMFLFMFGTMMKIF